MKKIHQILKRSRFLRWCYKIFYSRLLRGLRRCQNAKAHFAQLLQKCFQRRYFLIFFIRIWRLLLCLRFLLDNIIRTIGPRRAGPPWKVKWSVKRMAKSHPAQEVWITCSYCKKHQKPTKNFCSELLRCLKRDWLNGQQDTFRAVAGVLKGGRCCRL